MARSRPSYRGHDAASSRRLPGRRPRYPQGRCRSPPPLLCYPFLRRSRRRAVSRCPGRRPILRSASRALLAPPRSGSPCRCCIRAPYPQYPRDDWIDRFLRGRRGSRPKRNFCYYDDSTIASRRVEFMRAGMPGKCGPGQGTPDHRIGISNPTISPTVSNLPTSCGPRARRVWYAQEAVEGGFCV